MLAYMQNRLIPFFLLAHLTLFAYADNSELQRVSVVEIFSTLTIQHEGRLKPLDTFARVQLLAIQGRSSLPGLSASEWLLGLVTGKEAVLESRMFRLPSPQLVQALELPERKTRRYSLEEIQNGLAARSDWLERLRGVEAEKRTFIDNQLVNLYQAWSSTQSLANSLSCFYPIFQIRNEELSSSLGVSSGKLLSYYDFVLSMDKLKTLLKEVLQKRQNGEELDEVLMEAQNLAVQLHRLVSVDGKVESDFKIIPPIEKAEAGGIWLTPWEMMQQARLSSEHVKILDLVRLWLENNLSSSSKLQGSQDEQVAVLRKLSSITSLKSEQGGLLWWELLYNRANLVSVSLAFYICCFLALLLTVTLSSGRLVYKVASLSLIAGCLCHFSAVVLRMWIMQRPPVSTLYESIVFVALVCSLGGLWLERYQKDGIAMLSASLGASVLIFVSFSYANDGDTMGMLVAVLNSNFWLATHVVTITIGYGFSILASLLGHLYLGRLCLWHSNPKILYELGKSMHLVCLIALFFTLFGTILGGIWADQSWGRFWGWDPKENGALLIVLWQLLIIHAKLTGHIRMPGYALGMVMLNIIVALAWFGVNLLSVGLHSYGFTENIATNLTLFCVFELVIGFLFFVCAKVKSNSNQVLDSQN